MQKVVIMVVCFVTSDDDRQKNMTCWVYEKKDRRMADCFFNQRSKKYKSNKKRSEKITQNVERHKLINDRAKKVRLDPEFITNVHSL